MKMLFGVGQDSAHSNSKKNKSYASKENSTAEVSLKE